MVSLNISLAELQTFLLIFLRVGAILLTLPIFGSRNIPILFKAGLSFAISLLLYPILNLDEFPVQFGIFSFGLGIISEVILGVIIGLSVKMVFAGMQLAGQLVLRWNSRRGNCDRQTGLSEYYNHRSHVQQCRNGL